MRLPTVTPYKNLNEVEALGRALLDGSDDEDALSDATRARLPSRRSQQQEAALARVQLLLNRGSCPFAIEATASLCSAVMGDSAALMDPSNPESARAHDLARLAYSMAIVRLVNGVVDEHQSGLFAESIASLAARAHLPIWLVEIRHAATHQKTPSLPVLREACAAALKWLQFHYWRRLGEWVRVAESQVISEGSLDSYGATSQVNLPSSADLHDIINEAEARLALLTGKATDNQHSSAETMNAERLPSKENGNANLPTGWTRKSAYKMRPLGWTSTAALPA